MNSGAYRQSRRRAWSKLQRLRKFLEQHGTRIAVRMIAISKLKAKPSSRDSGERSKAEML